MYYTFKNQSPELVIVKKNQRVAVGVIVSPDGHTKISSFIHLVTQTHFPIFTEAFTRPVIMLNDLSVPHKHIPTICQIFNLSSTITASVLYLKGYDAVQNGRNLRTFRRKLLPPSSWWNMERAIFFETQENLYQERLGSHRRRRSVYRR